MAPTTARPRAPRPVDWAGRTFGQLTPAEQRRVIRIASAQLAAEMSTPEFEAAFAALDGR